MASKPKVKETFSFSEVSVDKIVKEIKGLGTGKAILSIDIPLKIPENNADTLEDHIFHFLSNG